MILGWRLRIKYLKDRLRNRCDEVLESACMNSVDGAESALFSNMLELLLLTIFRVASPLLLCA